MPGAASPTPSKASELNPNKLPSESRPRRACPRPRAGARRCTERCYGASGPSTPSNAASATSRPTSAMRARQAESVPVLDALRDWLDHTREQGAALEPPWARPCATSTTSGTPSCASVTLACPRRKRGAATASTPTPSRTPSDRSASDDATGCSPTPCPAPTGERTALLAH